MLTTLLAHAYALVGRASPALLAMQDSARPSGASGQSGGGGGGGSSGSAGFTGLLIPLAMVAFLYFFMIRPMGKQRKETEALNKSLQKGDEVVTSSGIVGKISGIDEQFITLEISEKVRVKFLREAVTRKLNAPAAGKAAATSTPADAKK
jgi:preprotein translocase subunit YajC